MLDDRLVAALFRQQLREVRDDVAHVVHLTLSRDVACDPAGVLDVLLTVEDLPDRLRLRPIGFHICTAKISELRRGLSSKIASVGVLERMPPSQ